MNKTLQPSACDVATMFARTPKILLVEDETAIVSFMRRVLSKFEVQIETAKDRAELEASLDDDYDLIILDLVIPDISRSDLLRLVSEKTACPVMVFSGNIDPQSQQMAISVLDRPIWFVEKPAAFSPETFGRVFRMFNLAVGRH